jgi:DNA-binding NtrC family response regulator
LLHEIGDLPMPAQTRVLHLLQCQELQRVGSTITHKVDVHVIATTSRNLRTQAAEGKFHKDLLARLSMIELELPPLCDRKEDLPLLQRHFLQRFSTSYGKDLRGISQRAQIMLARYSWPGNVRELESVIGNACLMAETEIIGADDLPEPLRTPTALSRLYDYGLISFDELQYRHLDHVLGRVQGNKLRAAEILGISRATLYDMLARRSASNTSKDLSA